MNTRVSVVPRHGVENDLVLKLSVGGWVASSRLPADKPIWVSFIELDVKNKVSSHAHVLKDRAHAGDLSRKSSTR